MIAALATPGDDGAVVYDVRPEQLILRDVLARDRTVLANERTLLAYVRTGLMLCIASATLYKLMLEDGRWVAWVAGSLALVGVLILIVGGLRFRTVHRRLRSIPEAPANDETAGM